MGIRRLGCTRSAATLRFTEDRLPLVEPVVVDNPSSPRGTVRPRIISPGRALLKEPNFCRTVYSYRPRDLWNPVTVDCFPRLLRFNRFPLVSDGRIAAVRRYRIVQSEFKLKACRADRAVTLDPRR